MPTRVPIFTLFTFCLLCLSLTGCGTVSSYEQPRYTVVQTLAEDIEIRAYAPQLVAEVTVSGHREKAINQGFRILADYIFGANTIAAKIPMTAPVTQQNTTLPMTSPVKHTHGDANNTWVVRFIMPSAYTLDTLPRPDDARITLRQEQAQRLAVIRFSGFAGEKSLARHHEMVLAALADHSAKPVEPAVYAFYNPPWTLPWLRRNEVMIPLE